MPNDKIKPTGDAQPKERIIKGPAVGVTRPWNRGLMRMGLVNPTNSYEKVAHMGGDKEAQQRILTGAQDTNKKELLPTEEIQEVYSALLHEKNTTSSVQEKQMIQGDINTLSNNPRFQKPNFQIPAGNKEYPSNTGFKYQSSFLRTPAEGPGKPGLTLQTRIDLHNAIVRREGMLSQSAEYLASKSSGAYNIEANGQALREELLNDQLEKAFAKAQLAPSQQQQSHHQHSHHQQSHHQQGHHQQGHFQQGHHQQGHHQQGHHQSRRPHPLAAGMGGLKEAFKTSQQSQSTWDLSGSASGMQKSKLLSGSVANLLGGARPKQNRGPKF